MVGDELGNVNGNVAVGKDPSAVPNRILRTRKYLNDIKQIFECGLQFQQIFAVGKIAR